MQDQHTGELTGARKMSSKYNKKDILNGYTSGGT